MPVRGHLPDTQMAPRPATSVPMNHPGAVEPYGDVLVSFLQGCGVGRPAAVAVSSEVAPGRYERLSKTELADLLLSLAGRCVDDRHPVIYVSVPVTTGPAYLEWCMRHLDGSRDAKESTSVVVPEVVATNRDRAHQVVERVRARLPGLVIDPSRLVDIDGWEQRDYHAFWIRVIGKYADSVVVVDGWQYSVGCTIEFAEAIRLGLHTMTEHFESLYADTGMQLIRAAIREYAVARVDSARLRDSLHVVERAATKAQSRSGSDV